jgi:hypothetical protein
MKKFFSTEGYLKNVRTGFRYYCFLLFIFFFRFWFPFLFEPARLA